MIWIALVLSIAIVGVLMWPVLRRAETAPDRAAYDLTVFQDQLKEVERDLARGVLSAAEADAARLEIQRRILAVGRAPAEQIVTGSTRSRWAAIAVTGLAVPLVALGAYLQVGTPDPAQAQLAALESQDDGLGQSDIDALVDRLAARVASEPDNPEGYAILARTYRELGRFEDAIVAFRRLIELQPSADAYSGLGEVLTGAQNGRVGDEAHEAMLNALALDRNEPRARFYLGLEQAGKGNPQGAIAIWRDLTGSAPADASWVGMVREQMAAVAQDAGIAPMSVEPKHPLDMFPEGAKAVAAAKPAPQGAAPFAGGPASALTASPEQTAMIQGMVAGLAARLESSPEDYDGWMMLGRSYTVLDDRAKAGDAYKKAIALKPKDVAPRLQYVGLLMMDVDTNADTPLPAELSTTVDEILKLQPDNAEALYLAGLGRARAGDAAGARGFWQKAQKVAAEGSALRNEIDRRMQGLK